MSTLFDLVERVAQTHAPVLITGESGTGKEILAREIHARSPRCAEPFVPLNCAAIANTLEESELFGHVRGAFTGADRSRQGRFEAADRGSLFLDEIGETSPSFQVKLLRILQDGEYAPVGETTNRRCDVRVIAATNQELRAAVQSGAFRSDLYYRLNVFRLHVPPLRERKEDIPLLVEHFVEYYCRYYDVAPLEVEPQFHELLAGQEFPGNVRELANYVHRAVILAVGGRMTAQLLAQCIECEPLIPVNGYSSAALPAGKDQAPPQAESAGDEEERASFHKAKRRLVEEFEKAYLEAVLTECGGIVSRAAVRAGLSERGFHQKLRYYNIQSVAFRAAHDSPE